MSRNHGDGSETMVQDLVSEYNKYGDGWYEYGYYKSVKLSPFQLSLAPDCSRLLSSPNIQSGKYNEMDPILIGTAVSEHVIREISKPAIPLVKARCDKRLFSSIFINT